MATLDVTADQIHVRFTPSEKALGLLRDHSFPRDAVTSVEVVENGVDATRGIRAPGLGVPRVRYVGTWRHRGGKDLVSVRRNQPALRIGLQDQRFDTLVIGVDDTSTYAELLEPAG